ncbi:ABC transporter ATP-binding protein [Phycisphaerales bacterium AB-hyl4]|uniref:ABC transporter ATP-binding protein n=1 Tax=Natronomicrosphaera hydrolytica TaxID=3242702 RepID=A0ABV4U4B6_9BACT
MNSTVSMPEANDQSTAAPLLVARGLHKHYRMGGEDLHVLRGVDLSVARGQWLAVLGASGSGKSTLLHLLGGLDRPDEGGVTFHHENRAVDIFALRGSKLDHYRNTHVGFVFQFYHLLPELSALENVLVSAMISRSIIGWPGARGEARERAEQLLTRVGLKERMRHRPAKLSGGERQRVAIARALINRPAVLLADEPTGNLDADTGRGIIDLFRELHSQGQTTVMVTHDQSIAAVADQSLTLVRGALVADQ